jgi:exopolysaccharide biosynthesis polyprenyl glycosylphosphotransferase
MAAHASQGIYPTRLSGPAFQRTRWNTSSRSRKAIVEAILLSATDFVLVWLSASIALSFRLDAGAISYGVMLAKDAGYLMLLSVLIVLFCHVQKLYELQPRTELEEAIAVLKAVGFATIVLSASLYLSGERVVSRIALGITVILSAITMASWRHIRRRRIAKRIAAGQDCRNVLVLGWSHAAELLDQHFMEHRLPGYVVKGFLDRRQSEGESKVQYPERRGGETKKVLGHINEFCDIVRAYFIDEVLVFLPEERELVKELIAEARRCGINLHVVPDSYDGLAWGAPIEHLGPFPTIQIHERPIPVFGLILKRCVDVAGSSLALLISLPISLVMAIAIRLDSRGPILYRSQRIGRKGITFTCYKFRTMVQNAEALQDQLRDLNERSGVLFKISNDPRITRVGRFLRKYSLDEIPQFWNVLCGDMSLVGPRPPVPGEYQQYELDHLKRLHVTPGITGLWQVEARTNPSFESYINLDSHYVDHWSVWLDMKILFKTVSVVFAGTGR